MTTPISKIRDVIPPDFSGVPGVPDYVRFWSKVDKSGDCWIWLGKLNRRGYGVFTDGHDSYAAYRWAWCKRYAIVNLPRKLHLHHVCKNPRCVRPEHLELKTARTHRSEHLAQTCKKGHPLEGDNVAFYGTQRVCRTCARFWAQGYRLRGKKSLQIGPRTECKRGHPYTDSNVYIAPDGRRRCRICRHLPKQRSLQ